MDDQELEAIRAKRMAEMQARAVSIKISNQHFCYIHVIKMLPKVIICKRLLNDIFQGVGGPGKMTGDPGSQAQAQEDKQRQVEDMKNSILNQVLTQEARARCKY